MPSSEGPNVLLIVADQLNFRHLGCYGNPAALSPAIDRLARGGIVAENAYCQAPLCMPSRASFNTGYYPHACRVRHNPVDLDQEFRTLAEHLKEAGYATAGFGHLGGDGNERGFDRKIDFCDDPLRSAYEAEQAHVLADGGKSPVYGGPHPFPLEQTFDGLATNAAIEYLEEVSGPFYLQVSFMRPHIPLFIPEPYASRFAPDDVCLPPTWRESLAGKPSNVAASRRALEMEGLSELELRRGLALYYGAVSFIDELTGRIVDVLERSDRLDDTLVIFTSDHGDYAGECGIIGKTGQFYDSLVHVPFVARGPSAGVAAGARGEGLMGLVDLVPTVLEACGVSEDADVQGVSSMDMLRGGKGTPRAVFASTSGNGGGTIGFNHQWDEKRLSLLPTDPYSSGPCSHVMDGVMVRSGRWKLSVWGDGSKELYNMETDPWERENLARRESSEAIMAPLLGELLRWQMKTWLPDRPQRPLPYHYRSAWIESIPEQWRKVREEWDARRSKD
jgi:choline-sulfatase